MTPYEIIYFDGAPLFISQRLRRQSKPVGEELSMFSWPIAASKLVKEASGQTRMVKQLPFKFRVKADNCLSWKSSRYELAWEQFTYFHP
jgi:hypothetical protein